MILRTTDSSRIVLTSTHWSSARLDTVARPTNPNASLEFLGHTARNRFQDCNFQMLSSLASNCHVLAGAGGLDRYAWFQRCLFMNAVNSTGVTINANFLVNAAAGGSIILDPNCMSIGATAWATTGPVYGPIGALGATTWGIGGLLT